MQTGKEYLDNATLQRLLLNHEEPLRRFIEQRLGADLRHLMAPDDVLQEVWIAAFRHSSRFHPSGKDSFENWLKSIATRTTINMAKAARRLKRGGGLRVLPGEWSPRSSYLALFNTVAGTDRTPSREVSLHEAEDAIRNVLAKLPEEPQRAVQMRFIEGKSFDEISKATGKTTPAVRSIIYRGLRQMRAQLGNSERFFSDASPTQQQ